MRFQRRCALSGLLHFDLASGNLTVNHEEVKRYQDRLDLQKEEKRAR